jgi:hypothetical protein
MEDAVGAVGLGGTDETLFESEQTNGVDRGRQGIAKLLQGVPIRRGLGLDPQGDHAQERDREDADLLSKTRASQEEEHQSNLITTL